MAYPIRFASRESIEEVKQRGKMFWECRQRKYVCYKGRFDQGVNSVVYVYSQRYMHSILTKQLCRSPLHD